MKQPTSLTMVSPKRCSARSLTYMPSRRPSLPPVGHQHIVAVAAEIEVASHAAGGVADKKAGVVGLKRHPAFGQLIPRAEPVTGQLRHRAKARRLKILAFLCRSVGQKNQQAEQD